MKTLEINHNNGHTSSYKLIEDGNNLPIAYKLKTSDNLVQVLERIRINKIRVKLNLGNTETGVSWNEENDITGRIGLSRGTQARFPILVYNSRSFGGGALMDDCILKITNTTTGAVMYQANNFKESIFEIKESTQNGYTHSLYINGDLYSNHKNEKSVKKLINKLK